MPLAFLLVKVLLQALYCLNRLTAALVSLRHSIAEPALTVKVILAFGSYLTGSFPNAIPFLSRQALLTVHFLLAILAETC